MSTSSSTSDLSLRLYIDDVPLPSVFSNQIRRIEVDSQVNLPAACEVEFADPQFLLIEECGLGIGNLMEIRAVVGDNALGQAIFFGQVETVEVGFESATGRVSRVRAYDAGHQMLHGMNTKGYPMMMYSEIAEVIGLEHDITTIATPFPTVYPMTVQSNESDWDFLVRLAREIGYVVNVQIDPVTGLPVLMFGPQTPAETAPPPLPGVEVSPLSFNVGDERIINLKASVSGSGITAVSSARGWDQTLGVPGIGERPTIGDSSLNLVPPELLGAELGGINQNINFMRFAQNEVQAESASEGLAFRMSGAYSNVEITMRGNPYAMPNRALGLSEAGVLTGEYTITGVTHTYSASLHGYRTHVVCSGMEDRTLTGLQGAAESRNTSKLHGVYPGIVTDSEDPEQMGRVLLNFPWLDPLYVSNWARVVQDGASEGMGMQIIPEPTDEVLVAFGNGQLDSPYVLGGLYNLERVPGVPWEEAIQGIPMIRGFTSRLGSQLLFMDDPETPGLVLNTTMGASTIIRLSPETGIEIITVEGQPILISSASDVTITSEGAVTVNAAAIAINGEGDVSISAAGALELTAGGEIAISAASINLEAEVDASMVAPAIDITGGIVNLGA
ncbi:MAG: VgrG-related protein [Candidatus Nanopelagicales bacterium]|nr:VgrG-related protein [Candidatus Nanopelagicales bacterium]